MGAEYFNTAFNTPFNILVITLVSIFSGRSPASGPNPPAQQKNSDPQNPAALRAQRVP